MKREKGHHDDDPLSYIRLYGVLWLECKHLREINMSTEGTSTEGTGERLATKEGIHTFPRYTCMMPSASAIRLAS